MTLPDYAMHLDDSYTYTYTLNVPPPPVGGYLMGNIRFMLSRKPSAWHRFWTLIILGWIWEDQP